MKTLYDKVKAYLEEEPRARERKNHKRAMVNILLNKYPELKEIPKESLVDFCGDFESATRAWRKVTEENKHLQGSDYSEKTQLEQKKQLELGYQVGYYQDLRVGK